MTHFERVQQFLRESLGAESIDDLPALEGKRADFFLFDRRVIMELKHLEDDREARVQAVLDQYAWTFPPMYGEVMLDRALKNNPYGEQIYSELVDAALASVEPAFKKANRQIRAMREQFSLPNSHGLLLFAVDDVYFFDPVALNYALARVFAKKTSDGAVRYPNVDWVFCLTAAHIYMGLDGKERSPIMSWISPHTTRRERLEELQTMFLEKWAAFLGIPLVLPSAEEIAAMKLHAKKTPAFKMKV
jgi:hypothetical protein